MFVSVFEFRVATNNVAAHAVGDEGGAQQAVAERDVEVGVVNAVKHNLARVVAPVEVAINNAVAEIGLLQMSWKYR